jgi:hypothetical protein
MIAQPSLDLIKSDFPTQGGNYEVETIYNAIFAIFSRRIIFPRERSDYQAWITQ